VDIAFSKEKDMFVVINLDDITIYSKFDEDHLKHLKQVFWKCRKFGISLNPKKSNFAMQEGTLVGHVISKEGIKIDPSKVVAIQKIELPRSRKEVQYFLGMVIFLSRFIPNFAEIMKYITNMLRKDSDVKWTPKESQSFVDIKMALTEALVLVSPDFTKEFLIFSFALEHTVA
jgi:hypothetical protein